MNSGPASEVKRISITARMAAWLFMHNHPKNFLSYKPVKAAKYAQNMREGTWREEEDRYTPIRINARNELVHGQHRMSAMSGCPDKVIIFSFVDNGNLFDLYDKMFP